MDRLAHYRQVIQEWLKAQSAFDNLVGQGTLETQTILDPINDRYLLLRSGWQDKKRIRSIIVYMRLHNGKIWIEEDWTEEGVTPALLKAGVPKEDIVLAFHHPSLRPLTEFAVA